MSTDSSAPTSLGWYGKLPSAGDFLQRRLPDPVVNNWAHWFHNGLVNLQRDAQGPNGHPFSNAPVWNFVIPATLGSPYVQMGCLLPARDRVGRRYPICALRLFSLQEWRPQQLNMAASWYQQLGHTLLNGVRNGFRRTDRPHAAGNPGAAQPAGGSGFRDIVDYRFSASGRAGSRLATGRRLFRPGAVHQLLVDQSGRRTPALHSRTQRQPHRAAVFTAVRAQRLGTPRPRRPVPANV